MNEQLKEREEFFLNNQPNEKFKEHYKEMLKNNQSEYYQILNEMETAYIFYRVFGISIIDFDIKTISKKDGKNGKNVDLLAILDDEKIYIEITGSKYKADKNSNGQQYAKLNRALEHGSKKFLENTINLLTIYDEQMYYLFLDQDFMYDRVAQLELEDPMNRKISGVLLFGQRREKDKKRNFIIYENLNSFKSGKKLFNILKKDPLCLNSSEVEDEIWGL